MSGISDYSDSGNSSRLILHVGAMLICCALTVLVIMKGESGSYFTMKPTVQFSIETVSGQAGQASPDVTIVELYGDVQPLSKSTPLVFRNGEAGSQGHSFLVRFPMEAAGKSLNYRIIMHSGDETDGNVTRISGTVSLAGGKTIVAIGEAGMKSGDSGFRHHSGQIVDLR